MKLFLSNYKKKCLIIGKIENLSKGIEQSKYKQISKCGNEKQIKFEIVVYVK